MNYKILLYIILLSAIISSCSSGTSSIKPENDNPKAIVKEKLGHPFGTLLKMEVEVFDGDSLKRKEYNGVYLFKIKTVDNTPTTDTLIMTFRDETDKFPISSFELYKHLQDRDTSSISSDQVDKLKRAYVGRVFNIVAYETGEFTGIPAGYSEYQGERADQDFHFKNYLVVVADITKADNK